MTRASSFDTPRALAELAHKGLEAAKPTLLALDFDGTLAEFVPDPEDAVLIEAARPPLERLNRLRGFILFFCSGRAAADLRSRTPYANAIHAGCHGLEIQGMGIDFIEPIAAALLKDLDALCDRVDAAVAGISGVWLERKRFSASLHFSAATAEARDQGLELVDRIVAARPEFELRPGLRTCEIAPRVRWDKGSAIEHVRASLNDPGMFTIAIGDDHTDEDMFRAVRKGMSIRVGSGAHPSRAGHRLAGPSEAAEFLARLAE